MKPLSVALLALSTGFLLTPPPLAWQMRHSLESITAISPLIVKGRVVDITSKMEADEKGRRVVCTYVKVEPMAILKGTVQQDHIMVRMLGGKVGNSGGWNELWMPFDLDEEDLLFLSPRESSPNIWEIKTPSGKIKAVNKNGERFFDCSVLTGDDSLAKPLVAEDVLVEKVRSFLSSYRGGTPK